MDVPLPGSELENIDEISKKTWTKPGAAHKATVGRHGNRANLIDLKDEYEASLVCECEEVSVGEVKYAIDQLDVHNLVDLRRRTRVGMGTCQGELCACRAAGLLADAHKCTDRAKADLKDFVNERWKGMYPICWGDTLRESEYSQWIYSGVCGLEDGSDCETPKAE
jgi:glycerol-3-phosphate dehydrogenase